MSAATEVIGLGHRGDSEDGVALDRQLTFNIPPTEACRLGRSVLPDQGCGSRKLPRAHDLPQGITHNVCLL